MFSSRRAQKADSFQSQGVVNIVDLGEECICKGREKGNGPDHDDDLDGPTEPGHGVLVEWVADGEVSLHGECKDGQHGGVAGPAEEHGCHS